MTLTDYIQAAIRTECDYAVTRQYFGTAGFTGDGYAEYHRRFRLLHAAMGIGGEAGELADNLLSEMSECDSRTNSIEELGDLAWFSAIACDVLGIKDIVLKPVDPEIAPFKIWKLQGDLQDVCKRSIFYGAPLNETKAKEIVGELWSCLSALAIHLGSSIGEVMRLNVSKLRQRYPQRFTEQNALNRNLAAEKVVLQNA